ncbi:MAG: GMC family oxidoreductase, partial [Pseudomonadota bacterium]
MLKDLSKIEQSPFDGQYDVCVAGSGPAGMTVALKMVETGARVLLLEAGGESYSEQSQAFYQGNSIGSRNYYGVQSCRLRYLGGTSGHWAGRCALFDPIDFEERDIFDLPGWPISYEETYEHLKEALDILDVEGDPLTRDTPAAWESDRMMAVAKGRSTPTRFGEKYRSALQGTENLDVVTHANLTDMTLSEDGTQIIAAEVRGYDNQIYPVKAKYYILAMGALENARFLLNANSQMPTGLGNTHDFVGRCFMEHLDIKLGRFLSTNDAFWQTIEGRGNGKLGLNPHKDVLTRRQLGN